MSFYLSTAEGSREGPSGDLLIGKSEGLAGAPGE